MFTVNSAPELGMFLIVHLHYAFYKTFTMDNQCHFHLFFIGYSINLSKANCISFQGNHFHCRKLKTQLSFWCITSIFIIEFFLYCSALVIKFWIISSINPASSLNNGSLSFGIKSIVWLFFYRCYFFELQHK
jgi:hypothetical protein